MYSLIMKKEKEKQRIIKTIRLTFITALVLHSSLINLNTHLKQRKRIKY